MYSDKVNEPNLVYVQESLGLTQPRPSKLSKIGKGLQSATDVTAAFEK